MPDFSKLSTPFSNISNVIHGSQDLPPEEKRKRFEHFLTNRRRMTRLALIQSAYYFEQRRLVNKEMESTEALKLNEEVNEIYRVVIFFYKKVFFPNRYGDSQKTKKLEEKFLRHLIEGIITTRDELDGHIKKYLKKGWTVMRLDSIVRSALRCATYEAIYRYGTETKVIISEYVQLVAGMMGECREINFINAILDKIVNDVRSSKNDNNDVAQN